MKRKTFNTTPPPPPLKIFGGVCAAMMAALCFAFAETAQAQTEECPEGETRVTSTNNGAGCFPNAAVDILMQCEAAGWLGRETPGTFVGRGELGCGIPSLLYTSDTASSGFFCFLQEQSSLGVNRSCTAMYGDPPVFPKAADHPNVQTDGLSAGPRFVANCDQDGDAPGGYPPDRNLNGETECVCNPNSHFGDWPDCTAFPTGATAADRAKALKCVAQGWTISTGTAPIKCEVPLTSGGAVFDGCFFGSGSPLCADVFGTEFAVPEKEPPEWVLNLANAFVAKSRDATLTDTVKAAAAVYAAAVWARYDGDSDYLDGPTGNHDSSSDDDKTSIALLVSGPVFTAHGIPFEWQPDLFRIPPAIRLAYSRIPVAVPYVFNCGEGMSPATANTDGATACAVADSPLRLRLRLFLEGPLR